MKPKDTTTGADTGGGNPANLGAVTDTHTAYADRSTPLRHELAGWIKGRGTLS